MPFDKTCLFVAPATDLYYAPKEAEAVVNLLGANLLNGKVEIDDLIQRVRVIQPKLLIISSHGYEGGIVLSDGLVGADLLKPILSTAPLECVYLNTCESYTTAARIHGEIPIAFLSTLMEVPDKNAYVTMSAFAYHLSNGEGYQRAWFKTKTSGNSNLLYLPPMNNYRKNLISGDGNSTDYARPSPRDGNGNISDLHEEVSKLSYVIYGNKEWQLPGVLPTIVKLQRQVNQNRLLVTLLIALGAIMVAGYLGRYLP